MPFPVTRHRRIRLTQGLRDLCRETSLLPRQLILPCFVIHGRDKAIPVAAMPGVCQYSAERLLRQLEEAMTHGIKAVMLFGIPAKKDAGASGAYNKNGVVQQAIRIIKKHFPELVVIADTCLCEYTLNGHCGIHRQGVVDNDLSLPLIQKTAISQAAAGADGVAPSCMFDGMVGAIRDGLDRAGFQNRFILSYAVKYASAFYGPFREAAGCGNFKGHRRDHQIDPPNSREAVKEALADVEEGADMVMVKPALAYLDIIQQVKQRTQVPVAAYHVSGEYALIVHGAKAGLVDRQAAMMEALYAIRRAGADMIITYFATEAAKILKQNP